MRLTRDPGRAQDSRTYRAKAALKDRFSERAFHNAVLAPGAVPLELLEREVDRYIRSASN